MRTSEIRKFILINTFILLLFFIVIYFDNRIVYAVSLIRHEILTDFFMGITFVSSVLIIFIFLTLLFLKENRRKWIWPLWITLAADIVISFLLKILVQRQRPFQLGFTTLIEGLEKSSHYVWDFSFPSFQAVMIFSAIPFLFKEFPKFKYVWVAFACLVGLSRVYLGLHFLSDVIAGALIGYLIGWFMIRKVERRF